MLQPLCALKICKTPYLWDRAGGTVISSLSALHTTPTSLPDVPMLAKWETVKVFQYEKMLKQKRVY